MANTYGGMADVFKKDIIKSQSPFTKDKDYIKYVDGLVERAKIEFVDFEVKKLLEER